jgi:hypothetical protein
MRLVHKNPMVAVVPVVARVADEDFLADGLGAAEDVDATSCVAFVPRRRICIGSKT